MRKSFVTLITSLLTLTCSSAAFAFLPEVADATFDLGVGFRRDRLSWETKENHSSSTSELDSISPSVGYSSRLDWKRLNIWQVEAKTKVLLCDDVYFRAYADYGWITSGKNTATDRCSINDVSSECFRSDSNTRGQVYDVSLGIGYQFKMCDDSFSLTPVLGYSWEGQHLRDRNEEIGSSSSSSLSSVRSSESYTDSYSSISYSSGSSSGSGNSTRYNTRWNGPWLGFDIDYRLGCDWVLFGTYEYHWATYHAHANWAFQMHALNGFNHRASNAHGQVVSLGARWDFCDCWTVSLAAEYQAWRASHGRNTIRASEQLLGNRVQITQIRFPLHDVRWDSASLSIDVGYVF